jgi:hypothetical protein
VFGNKVPKKIFELKRDEVRGEWRRLHNKKLHYFCSSPNTIRVIKSRKIRLTVHVACMRRGQVHGRFWSGNLSDLREAHHLADLGVDGRIILNGRSSGNMIEKWSGFICLRIGVNGRLV